MKYEECGTVEVKESFEVFLFDEYDEPTGEKETIQVGTCGEIVSYGWSSTDGFRNRYDVELQINGDVKSISLYENELEQHMHVTPFPEEAREEAQ
ncbi:hypothetical protein [Paenibacillus sp. FSL L8-0708]|uniref:hypothetical protein n=1 Tax=Paenibacillus sp. FSL L8-0708 TaxID=2975311 RepID=UPI0030F63979